ncbi:Hypp1937 [Branchiostoma lanceolatum]|uniref:Hypp1937 protein n=1 Tax=Branchiostoma lanceolatum TaxID=7740 RepID=A0A8J9ZQ05_BRALA|nr:Hypp1937 [Branchiostoma lanceolatum]
MASSTVQPSSPKNSTGDYAFGMSTVYPMKISGAGIIITTAVLVFLVCLIIILKIIHLTWTPGGKSRRKKKSSDSEVPWFKRMSMRMTRKSPTDVTDNDASNSTVSMTLSEKEAESTRSETPTVLANTMNNKRMSVQSNWSVVSHVGKVAFGKKQRKTSKKERRATIKDKHERKGSKKDKGGAKDSDKEKGGTKESMKEKRRESKKEKSERKLSKKQSKKDRMVLSKHLSTLPGEVPPIVERKLSIP